MNPIVKWVLQTMMKGQTGVVRTLPNKKLLDINVNMTVERLIKNGIDPSSLKTPDQVDNIIKQIEQPKVIPADSPRGRGITEALFGKKGEVFDMKGKKIKPGSKLMGGEEVKDSNVDAIIQDIKSLEPITAMKEANNIIARKGKYKNLTSEESKKILQETEDHIFERDVPFDPQEDFATGGRAGFKGGLSKAFLEFMKKFKVKQSGDDVKDFLSKRQFMKDIVGNTKANEKARELRKIKENVDNYMKQYKRYQFPSDEQIKIDLEKRIQPILNKSRKLNSDGGRIGYKDGPNMGRRTFLKILGGLASIPIVGKFLKPIKTAKGIKSVPIIKTDNVAGKPEWFDALVNKVIIEGDDVTKKFATAERQSIHQKTLDDGSVVRVTEDVDDGAVRVEYESEANVFGDDVLMEYKKPLPNEGDPRPTAEFTTAESGPVGRQSSPDDFDLDVDEVGGSSISDLDSDVSKLKEYATGQKPTLKEIVQNKKRKDKAKAITEDPEAQNDAVIRRQGDYDPSYDDYASGGIARMLGE